MMEKEIIEEPDCDNGFLLIKCLAVCIIWGLVCCGAVYCLIEAYRSLK